MPDEAIGPKPKCAYDLSVRGMQRRELLSGGANGKDDIGAYGCQRFRYCHDRSQNDNYMDMMNFVHLTMETAVDNCAGSQG